MIEALELESENPDCIPGFISYYLFLRGKLYNLSGPHFLSTLIHLQIGPSGQISEGNPEH